MRPADSHLTPQELESLLLGPAEPRGSDADSASAREAQQHLSGCAVCQSVAEKYRKADEILGTLRPLKASGSGQSARKPECPSEETWLSLAAGLMADDEAAAHVSHAATCDRCGPLLKEAMQDLAQNPTAEEQVALAELPMASVSWQRQMATKLAGQQRKPTPDDAVSKGESPTAALPKEQRSQILEQDQHTDKKEQRIGKTEKTTRPAFRWWPKLAWGIAAGVLISAAGGWIWWNSVSHVNRLLAQAYTSQRTIELRMQGADYAPLAKGERGANRSDWPASLDSASVIIKRELPKHFDDPYWLQARARARLLQGDARGAHEDLEKALLVKPSDTTLLLDQASTLFQLAERTGDTHFYGEAVERLGDVLKQDSHNRVALFNRAIVQGRMHALKNAINDFKEFLDQEPSGPWADEARRRRQELQEEINKHDQARAQPLLSPGEFVRVVERPERITEIDRRIEDYQEEAIGEWLLAAFPLAGRGNREALSGLHALADVLSARHKDDWLQDFLDSSSNSTAFAAAIMALHNAVNSSKKGEWQAELSEARKATNLFLRTGSAPGQLRAAIEEVHALRGEQQGKTCLQWASATEEKLRNVNYRWIDEQMQIDQCSCAGMVGNLDRADKYIEIAQKTILESNYPTLHLRAMGIAASINTISGRVTAAWAKNEQGLQEYWRGSSPPVRAQQFYDDLTVSAEELGEWNLALAFDQESARAISLTADRETEAMVRRHLAKLAIQAGDFELGREELRRSDELTSISREKSLASNTYSEIDRAQIDLQQARWADAEQRLKAIEVNLREISSFEISLAFYSVRASLLERKGQTKDAANDFRRALEIINSNANNLSSIPDRYLWQLEVSALYRSLVGLEIEQGNFNQALEIWEWYRATPLRVLSPSLDKFNPFGTKRVIGIFPSGSSGEVISYAVLPRGLAIWVIKNNKLVNTVFWRGDPRYLVRLTSHFTALCMTPDSDLLLLRQEARQLYSQFIAPISKNIADANNLSIETDEILGDLPLEVLVSPENHYLVESHSITYSPGLLYGTYLRSAEPLSPQSRVVALGSTAILSNPEWSLDSIPEVQAEAQAVADRFHGVVLRGREASVGRLEGLLPQAEIVHLAAHGLITSRTEGLLLFAGEGSAGTAAQDAILWDAERARPELFRRAKLVVLSACSSGKSTKSRLEVHGGLVRALLGAGVPNVVASRWNVDSARTVEFMDEFYSRVIHGSSVSSALTSAEEQVRTKMHREHPYYWAAFAVIGRG